jgi:carbonic anhydrase
MATFEALQFHIHLGSDHALDGTRFGADVHLVHKQVNGTRLAVTGNMAFSSLIDGCCKAPRQSLVSQARPNVRQTQATFDVPVGFSTYYYQGSLTTPPCSEIFNWNVVDKPVLVAQQDFDALSGFILKFVGENCTSETIARDNKTARPLQACDGRTITRKCPFGSVALPSAPIAAAPMAAPVAAPVAGHPSTAHTHHACGLFHSNVLCVRGCGFFGHLLGLCHY